MSATIIINIHTYIHTNANKLYEWGVKLEKLEHSWREFCDLQLRKHIISMSMHVCMYAHACTYVRMYLVGLDMAQTYEIPIESIQHVFSSNLQENR